MEAQNAFSGQGAVLLDIGDDVGALIVEMPAELTGVEIEIRPVGAGSTHSHDHDDSQGDGHPHHHGPGDSHDHSAAGHHPHVAVVVRPTSAGFTPSAVFGDLTEGTYELYEKLDGPVRLIATVRGGEVTQAQWPVG